MKKIIFFFAVLLFNVAVNAQNIEATYEVTITRWPGEPYEEVLSYTWKVFVKGNKVASYFIPGYRDKFPDGMVKKQKGNLVNTFVTTQLPVAGKLDYEVFDADSMFVWVLFSSPTANASSPCAGRPNTLKVRKEAARFWTFLDETKNIDGLNAQRVEMRRPDGELGWDAWVATEIQVPGNTTGMYTIPFLLVEGKAFGTGRTYTLLSVNLDAEVDDAVFWPECFEERFDKGSSKK